MRCGKVRRAVNVGRQNEGLILTRLKEGFGAMRFSRRLNWTVMLLCALGGTFATGCTAEATIGGMVETPPPPPPPDGDGDGILDPDDKCPDAKEDGQPPDPNDGCPNNDADGDGIPVPADKCPTEPETVNGFEDEDGCPDTKPLVTVTATEVKIAQKILFAHNSADIDPSSTKILDAVADVMKKNPDIQLIEVGGHASVEGDPTYNKTLTQKRVDSVVKALVERGVEKDRMMSQGYGLYCPLDAGTTEEAHEKNRRVEFKILQRGGKNTDIARGCDNALKKGVALKKIPAPKPVPTATPDTSAKTDTKADEKKGGFGSKK